MNIWKRRFIQSLCLSFFIFLGVSNAQASYRDVPENHKYLPGIQYVQINGASDERADFYPDHLINRAEAMKLLFQVFGEDVSELEYQSQFKDVPNDAWYAIYMQLAAQNGLFEVEKGEIQPGKTLRRGESYQLLLEAYGYGRSIIPKKDRARLFRDIGPLHPYYESLRRAADIGILNNDTTESFLPYQEISRAEFAQLIYRFDKYYLSTVSESDFYKSDILEEIWNLINTQFYLEEGYEVDPEVLFQATVRGMVESLNDPFTTFFPPEEGDQFITTINGEFEGIGAFLFEDPETGEVSISGFLPNSPAEEAGLEIGDVILEVNDESVEGKTLEQIANRIRGAEGSRVEIRIERNDRKLVFNVERKALSARLAWGEIYEDKYWMLHVKNFTGSMLNQIEMAIDDLKADVPNPKAIIIDLRGNSGGLVELANGFSGLFLPNETPLMSFHFKNNAYTLNTKEDGPYQDIPLYILINKQSASASEIVASALKEQADAILVGTPSYGKNTAQRIERFDDGSILKLTVAEWLTSKGNSVEKTGVIPDVKVNEPEKESNWLEILEDLLD